MKFNLQFFQNNKQKKIINALVVIFCIGMAIVILNKDNKMDKSNVKESEIIETSKTYNEGTLLYSEAIEKKLEKEFSKIEGAGNVDVIIIMKTKGEIILNKDEPYTSSRTVEKDNEGGSRENDEINKEQNTVLIRRNDGSEEAIIIKELLPEVNGILILSEGSDDLIVKSNLINAAKVLLDLPVHKIEVMKRVRD